MEGIHAVLYEWVRAHGMIGVSVFMLIENACVPFPTELGFIVAQGLVHAGHNSYWEAFAFIMAGHLVGSGGSYYLGRAGDNAIVRRFAGSPRMMRARTKLRGWYAHHGALAVLFGRLVGQVRPWASLVAGMSGVPPLKFWVWTVVGTAIYAPLAMWATAWGWDMWGRYPGLRVPAIIVTLFVFYGAAAIGLGVELLRRYRKRHRAAKQAAPTD